MPSHKDTEMAGKQRGLEKVVSLPMEMKIVNDDNEERFWGVLFGRRV